METIDLIEALRRYAENPDKLWVTADGLVDRETDTEVAWINNYDKSEDVGTYLISDVCSATVLTPKIAIKLADLLEAIETP